MFQIMIDYDMKFQEAKENLYTRYNDVLVPFMLDFCFETDLADPSLEEIFDELTVRKHEMSQGKIK